MKYFIIIIILFLIWGFFIEPNLIVVKKYKIKNLGFKRIVFASDFHISKYGKNRLNRIIGLINAQKPDLVILGGDFIKGHTGKNTLPIEEIAYELSKINSITVSVLGNHDGWYDKYRVKNSLEKNGIKVLLNSNAKIGDLYISGVEDLQTGLPNIKTALEGTQNPRILVSHTPDIYYDVKDNVNLILAGHVHGGQVRVLGMPILVPSKYGNKFACGDYKETQNRMIVTKGLGTSILNVRLGTIPEIVLLEESE